MLLAGALILYRHMTHIDEDGDHIKNFLGLILIQMVPLVILECKIMSTTDPVGLFCKFATPVTLMHAVFLGIRLCHAYYQGWTGSWYLIFANYGGLGFVGALLTLVVGFKA